MHTEDRGDAGIALDTGDHFRVSLETESAKSAYEIRTWLLKRMCQVLQLDPDDIDASADITQFGLDSMAMLEITGDLEDWLEETLDPVILYRYRTIGELVDALCDNRP